jgi:hypothetical protein
MFKRFMIGFVLGVGLMYWYIHYSGETVTNAEQWAGDSAAAYRGDAHKRAADQALGH